jgi:hypothetical protein
METYLPDTTIGAVMLTGLRMVNTATLAQAMATVVVQHAVLSQPETWAQFLPRHVQNLKVDLAVQAKVPPGTSSKSVKNYYERVRHMQNVEALIDMQMQLPAADRLAAPLMQVAEQLVPNFEEPNVMEEGGNANELRKVYQSGKSKPVSTLMANAIKAGAKKAGKSDNNQK